MTTDKIVYDTSKPKKEKRPANHYIDKEEFSNEMDIHALECREARARGEGMPRCPESIGKKFLLIATNVSNKGNFFNYSYKDEMICDALENMVRYRYNYEKVKGAAFSYFTQYAMFAFISRIKLEKKELTKKAKWVQRVAIHEMMAHTLNDADVGDDFKSEYFEYLVGYYDEKLDDVEKSKLKKPKKKVEEVVEEDPDKPGPLGI
jgi:hypothetical protein